MLQKETLHEIFHNLATQYYILHQECKKKKKASSEAAEIYLSDDAPQRGGCGLGPATYQKVGGSNPGPPSLHVSVSFWARY